MNAILTDVLVVFDVLALVAVIAGIFVLVFERPRPRRAAAASPKPVPPPVVVTPTQILPPAAPLACEPLTYLIPRVVDDANATAVFPAINQPQSPPWRYRPANTYTNGGSQ